ncbi:hypothetical protein FRX31_026293, partial [Thalictrum thalictroides]
TLSVDNLKRKGQNLDPIWEHEYTSHILLHCSKSLEIWKAILGSSVETYAVIFVADSVEDWLRLWLKAKSPNFGELWQMLPFAVCWLLWKTCNNLIFAQKDCTVERICNEIK